MFVRLLIANIIVKIFLYVLEILFTSISTLTKVDLSIYFILFIDIFNAFVAL